MIEFLLARIAEDEAVARSAIQARRPGERWRWEDVERDTMARLDGEYEVVSLRTVEEFPTTSGVGPLPAFVVSSAEVGEPEQAGAFRHIARWDPARVLAECEAKRAIVDVHHPLDNDPEPFCWNCDEEAWPCKTMVALTAIYADHPDCRTEWGHE